MAWWRHDCGKHGHRFEARTDFAALTPEQINEIGFAVPLPSVFHLAAAQGRTYVRDVCVPCGETRERKP